MYNSPYTGYNPVNIYQSPLPQNDEIKKIEEEYRQKLAQAMGLTNQKQQNQNQPKNKHQDYQKLILQFLEEVYSIPEKEFNVGFEEYVKVVEEREKQEEDNIKKRVRDKIYGSTEVIKEEKPKRQKEIQKEEVEEEPPPQNTSSGNKYKKGGA